MCSAEARKLVAVAFTSCLLPLGGSLFASDELARPTDLSGYRFVSALVVNDPESPLFGFHHFYANDNALEGLADGGPYPEGAVFVGLVYQVKTEGLNIDEGRGAAVTLMKKVPGAQETGGWRFAQFDPAGKRMEIDEAKDCFGCHTQVKDRDYVFPKPLGVGDLSSLK